MHYNIIMINYVANSIICFYKKCYSTQFRKNFLNMLTAPDEDDSVLLGLLLEG